MKRAREETEEATAAAQIVCPYLDTIDRASLDFDFEKLCSVSLTNLNVYGCLVCGKYFQGRAKGSPAYNHSLGSGHHVFLNLQTAIVYCLPDLYEVHDASLADIKYNLNPTYTPEQIDEILCRTKTCRGLDGKEFRPGLVGLNNLKMTDYLNAVVQLLVRIPELCRYFMSPFEYSRVQMLTARYGELIRKMWNPRAFKGQVSPHELMQAITIKSAKKFQIGQAGDPVALLQFLLTALHEEDLKGNRQRGAKHKAPRTTSIIYEIFQGRVRVMSQEVMITDDGRGNKVETNVGDPEVKEVPFLFLQFDLPDTPLFKDESERNIIPQVPLFTLLHKYDGEQVTYQPVRGKPSLASKVRYKITKLPRYLIFCYKRFKMNYWFEEKNKTIVNFPIKSLDLRDFCELSPSDAPSRGTKYDLLGNLCHDGTSRELGNGYFTHTLLRTTGDWWMVHDLELKTAEAQEIACTAPYIQVWECQGTAAVPPTTSA
jgi:U4/U6.U5 tri-snRNP-associated protein 2